MPKLASGASSRSTPTDWAEGENHESLNTIFFEFSENDIKVGVN